MCRLARPCGFEPPGLSNYLRLAAEQTFCVDEPGSVQYNRIVTRSSVPPRTSGEEMWRIPEYRAGLLIDYNPAGQKRAGSCIFVHVWQGPDKGTAGCVATDETTVRWLQQWTAGENTLIAIRPDMDTARWRNCLGRVE